MTIAIIGAGTIGGAIVESLLVSKYDDKIIATRRRIEKIEDLRKKGVLVTKDNEAAANEADAVMLCVKPKDIGSVLNEIEVEISGKLVISIAAATTLKFLKENAPKTRFIRAMPNVSVLVQESFTAYSCDEDVTAKDKVVAEEIFKCMGDCAEVEEKYMDVITALSGSVPAYTAIIIESLMYAGLKMGLPRGLALNSSVRAVMGGAKLALKSSKHIAELKDMVVTPGGVTIEGIFQLEEGRIRTTMMRAVEAATLKSKKITEELMSQQARPDTL